MNSRYNSKIRYLIIATILIFVGTLMVTANPGNKTSNAVLSSTSQFEIEYSVENWMFNLNEWTSELEDESIIEIESWMLEANDNFWNTKQETEEEEFEVEEWMTNLAKW